MIKFNRISQIERSEYPFEDAVLKKDALNGDFGAVTDGEFDTAADSFKAIMQNETGDDMGMPEYKIKAGEHVRVLDLAKFNGQAIEVYGAQLPAAYAKGDKLKSNASGKLVSGATAAPYLEVTDIVGNKIGLVAKIVAATATVSGN